MPQSFEARPHPPSTLSPRPPPPRYEDSSPGFEGSRKGRNEYLSPRDVLRDARTMRAEGMGALGLHAPRSDNARRRNPWGHADATFHKGAHNQAPAPSAGAFHRSQNAVIVDGVFDPLGQRQPPPSEREQLVELVARHSPIVPRQSLSTTQVLNSGPHLGGDTEAAAEEAWQIAQSTGANALGKGPDPEEEQRYRVRASPPTAKPARCGAGPGLVGEEVGVYGAGLAEQMMADSAAAARYQVERTASGPYHASRGLRRTSRPDVHFLASPRTGHPTPTDTSDRALQDLIHATASGMRAKGGEPAVAPLRVDSYWPNHKGVAAGHVPGGNNPMIGTGHQLDLSAMISREKKVPTLWGHGGRTDDVQKCQMASIRDVERYIASLRDKPPSPPPKKNLGGEPVAQMLPDYPLPPTLPAVTPAGCVRTPVQNCLSLSRSLSLGLSRSLSLGLSRSLAACLFVSMCCICCDRSRSTRASSASSPMTRRIAKVTGLQVALVSSMTISEEGVRLLPPPGRHKRWRRPPKPTQSYAMLSITSQRTAIRSGTRALGPTQRGRARSLGRRWVTS